MNANEQEKCAAQPWVGYPQPGWASEQAQAVEALFAGAFRLQQDGRVAEAARLYEQILKIDPRHADSLHLLGMIAWRARRPELAIGLIGRAIALKGNVAAYHSNLGTIVQALGRLSDAGVCYRRALELDPELAEVHLNLGLLEQLAGHLEEAVVAFERAATLKPELAEAWSNLGNVLQTQGKLAEAEEHLLRAVALKPTFAEALYNLGNVFLEQDKLTDAGRAYEKAIELKPELASAWSNLGNVRQKQARLPEAELCQRRALMLNPLSAGEHYNLGSVLALEQKNEEAEAELKEALRLDPRLTKARNNLGSVYRTLERPAEAVEQFAQIPKGDPEFAGAYNNMGLALLSLGRHEEAEQAVRETLALQPDLAEAWCNLGVVFHAQNRLDEALTCYRRAQELKPDLAKVRMNLGLIELVRGHFAEGWKQYEWRWENAPMVDRGFPQPQWRGEALHGARILLHAEQGYGDTLQFLRYVPMVRAAGGTVLLEVQDRAVRLAQELEGVAEVIRMGDPLPAFDWHCPLLSLPTAFRTTLENIPAQTPYLYVPEEARRKMAANVNWEPGKLRVGLQWAGNPTFRNDRFRFRSVPLAELAPLLGVEDVAFYSLQVGAPVEELRDFSSQITDLSSLTADLADTAAAIEHLDLVIAVDTSVVHLAGGLAAPTWLLLPQTPDWRWLLEREDSPWYPEMRLFRQQEPGEWAPAIERVRQALEALAKERKV